jgi:thiol-disulfide isomerase/thioredoxin
MRTSTTLTLLTILALAGLGTPTHARQPAANAGDAPAAPGPGTPTAAVARVVTISPLALPPDFVADPAEAKRWAQLAVDAARAAPRFWIVMRSESEEKRLGQPTKIRRGMPDWQFIAEGGSWAIRWQHGNFGADADRLWFHSVYSGEWTETPLADVVGIDPADWARSMNADDLASCVALSARLEPSATLEELFENVQEWIGFVPGQRDGRPGVWVYAWFKERSSWSPGGRSRMRMWIDEQTRRITLSETDNTATAALWANESPDAERQPPLELSIWRVRFEYRDLDGPIAAADLGPQLEPGDVKVDRIDFRAGAQRASERQMALLGKPAPALELATLDGGRQKLSDLRGRVVILDFWAKWCGPCVETMPKLQAISERFKDRPVTVMGVNVEPDLEPEAVRRLLDKRGITFPQMLAAEQEDQDRFGVRGFPHMVLIDPNGVVQDIRIGSSKNMEPELVAQIEKLLAGQALATEETVRARKAEEAEKRTDVFSLLSKRVLQAPGNVNPERVKRDESFHERFNGWMSSLIDIPEMGGWVRVSAVVDERASPQLKFVPENGGPVRSVRLERFPAGLSPMGSCIVELGGQRRVLIAAQANMFVRGGRSRSLLYLYDFEGRRLAHAVLKGQVSNPSADVLRLSDGREVILAAVHSQGEATNQAGVAEYYIGGRLMVLDPELQPLMSRVLGAQPYSVRVLEQGRSGGPAIVQLIGGGSVERFSVDTAGW